MRSGGCSASRRVPACTASIGCPATGGEQPQKGRARAPATTPRRHELASRGRHRGTFTDLVALDQSTGALQFVKRPSTPHAPGQAVLDVLSRLEVPLQQVALLVLGTTVGTNAVLQRSGARVIYLTTAGFEDIPYIQRIDKKDPYDLQWLKPQPFVARRDCLGVDERVTSDGTVLRPLTDAEMERVTAAVERRLEGAVAGVAIAINLLFSYASPAHERALARCCGSGSRASRSRCRATSHRSGASTSVPARRSSTRTCGRGSKR